MSKHYGNRVYNDKTLDKQPSDSTDLTTARGIVNKWQRTGMCFDYDGHLLYKAETALAEAIEAALQAQRNEIAKLWDDEALWWGTMAEGPWKDGDYFQVAIAREEVARKKAAKLRAGGQP